MKSPKNSLQNTQRFRRTRKGILTNIYQHQKARMKVEYSLRQLQERFVNDRRFIRLHTEWIKNNCDKQYKPTIDRINSRKNYSLRNIHCLTWAENRFKQSALDGKRGIKPAVFQIMGNKVIKRFQSQRHVVKELGISQGNLSSVLNGKRKYVNGYKFIYENPELVGGEGAV